MVISFNWKPQSGYFCFLVLYLTTFLLQRNQLLLKCLYHPALSWLLLFLISGHRQITEPYRINTHGGT